MKRAKYEEKRRRKANVSSLFSLGCSVSVENSITTNYIFPVDIESSKKRN